MDQLRNMALDKKSSGAGYLLHKLTEYILCMAEIDACCFLACASNTNKQRLVSMLESLLHSLKEQAYSFQHSGGCQLWSKHCRDTADMLDTARNISVPLVTTASSQTALLIADWYKH